VRRASWLGAALAGLCALAWLPGLTGYALHEVLGLACAAALLVHTARAVRPRGASRAGRLVSGALLVCLAVCAVSGLMVSGAVLPALGLCAGGYFFWDPLHAFSTKLLLGLVAIHLALNGRAAVRLVRGLLPRAKATKGRP
jgi:hypothetical protein